MEDEAKGRAHHVQFTVMVTFWQVREVSGSVWYRTQQADNSLLLQHINLFTARLPRSSANAAATLACDAPASHNATSSFHAGSISDAALLP
jgi:hypothetical protein